jgi:16S rRNA (guanine527-N7)-methyltransferase
MTGRAGHTRAAEPEVGSPAWQRLLCDAAAALGLDVTPEQGRRLALHAVELLRWNKRQNLTAITAPRAVAVKHYLDCLAAAQEVPHRGRVLDIGSGGGFPGIPLAIVRPALTGVLLDAVRKKTAFLGHVLRLLKLTAWQARHGRAEALAADPDCRDAFDVVCFRALTGCGAGFDLARPFVRPGGTILALKGPGGQRELLPLHARLADQGWGVSLRAVSLPWQGGERVIVVMRRPVTAQPDLDRSEPPH